MSSFPGRVGALAGILVFLTTGLLCLLRGGEPLLTLKRAGLSALVAAAVIALSTRVALGVLHAGLRQYHEENAP